MTGACVFCEIVAGREPASVVFEDDRVLCFMTRRPTRDGECLVIPKEHIDHFLDLPRGLSSHLYDVVRRVGLAVRAEFDCRRVGLVVHGFGVGHAHFIIVPQHDPHDITSGRFAVSDGATVSFRHDVIPIAARRTLDENAVRLGARLAEVDDDG